MDYNPNKQRKINKNLLLKVQKISKANSFYGNYANDTAKS